MEDGPQFQRSKFSAKRVGIVVVVILVLLVGTFFIGGAYVKSKFCPLGQSIVMNVKPASTYPDLPAAHAEKDGCVTTWVEEGGDPLDPTVTYKSDDPPYGP